MPIVRVDVERLGETISHAMMAHDEQINNIIQERLKERLSDNAIIEQIQESVDRCLDAAINSLSGDWQLKEILRQKILECLS